MDPREILQRAEKVESTATPASEASIEDFMRGSEWMGGNQNDYLDRGIGSGIGVSQRGADPFEVEPTPLTPEQASGQVDTDWQKLYGNSENEKGAWRRTAQEAMSQLEQMKAELEQMRQAFNQPQQPGYGYAQPQQAQHPNYAAQSYTQQPYQLPQTFFPDKQEGDYVEVKDVDNLVKSAIAPAVMQLWQQTAELQRMQLEASKATQGITPQIERTIVTRYPWIAHMPEGPARIQAMADIMRGSQPGGGQSQVQSRAPASQPTPTGIHPAEAAARRVVYVESGQKAATGNEEMPLQQRIEQEFNAARTAEEKRKVLMKYGMAQVNDFGRDVLTR